MTLSRSLAIALGLLAGFWIGERYGNLFEWLFLAVAAAVATDVVIQTIRNVGPSGYRQKKQQGDSRQPTKKKLKLQKPEEPHF